MRRFGIALLVIFLFMPLIGCGGPEGGTVVLGDPDPTEEIPPLDDETVTLPE